MIRRALLVTLALMGGTAARAQEETDIVTRVIKTATGAVLEEREGIDGGNVEHGYTLTRLTCSKGSTAIQLLMPVVSGSAEEEASTLREKNGTWSLSFRVNHRVVALPVSFVAIGDPLSYYGEGAQVEIPYGESFWRGLVYAQGDGVVALTGGFGQYIAIDRSPELATFEDLCGLP